jgi:hypothetical protein
MQPADFFDGKHNITLGGSWATHPRLAGRKTLSVQPYITNRVALTCLAPTGTSETTPMYGREPALLPTSRSLCHLGNLRYVLSFLVQRVSGHGGHGGQPLRNHLCKIFRALQSLSHLVILIQSILLFWYLGTVVTVSYVGSHNKAAVTHDAYRCLP